VPYSVKSGWHVEWNKAAVSTGTKWRPGSSIAPDAWLTRRVPQMTTEVTGSGTTARKDQIVVDGSGGSGTSTDQERDAEASKLVERFSLWSGAAGLIPLPIIDIATVAGLQLQMVRRLSEIYGVPFTDNRGKSIIASLMGSMIPASSGMGVASALKSVPFIGTAAGTLTMSGVSAGATYAIGKVFIQHFASGGTLLDFDPPDYREFIKAQKDKWSSRSVAAPPAAQPGSSTQGGSSTGAGTA
jgi:uncharacterized protein (DUF697 family)